MDPPSCFPFPKHDRTRDDEDKQRHHHATENRTRDDEDRQRHHHAAENQKLIPVQSKPKSKPKRRRITQTKQNQRKIKGKIKGKQGANKGQIITLSRFKKTRKKI